DLILERAATLLGQMGSNSNSAMRHSKRAIDVCTHDPFLRGVGDPAAPMVASLQAPDFREGTSAFLEKRKAKFS
ncbi:enoyl-CoA hydratase, partial [Thermodesulfobacteriota bacterium]